MALGDILEIDDRTLLVIGQELSIAQNQPDVANVLLHRVNDTLFMIDSGVTVSFRAALKGAIDRLGPWHHLVLLTTHGHPDHVGNNDLIDELATERDVTVSHFLPAGDIAQMVHPKVYWESSFDRLNGVVALPAPPKLIAHKVVSLFQPLRPFGRTTRTFEELPLERFSIGSLRLTGWTFADGAVRVVRSQGHCAGHVVVHLRDSRLLHLADELNGPCAVMHDADQVKLSIILGAAATMIDEQQVKVLTDGHSFTALHDESAAQRIDAVLEQSIRLQDRALVAAGGRSVEAREFGREYSQIVQDEEVGGANPNPMFAAMMALNALGALGFAAKGPVWQRPSLSEPASSVSGPVRILQLLAAGASLAIWRLRGKSK